MSTFRFLKRNDILNKTSGLRPLAPPYRWRGGGGGKAGRMEKQAKRRERKKAGQKEGCNTRTSQEVTHPSTTLAQARLTAEF